MPLYLHACKSPQCSVAGVAIEHFFFRSDPPAPACEYCGGPTERRIGFPNVLWTRPLSSYNDPTKENAHEEGHWAWRTHTVSGNPEPVFITNFQEGCLLSLRSWPRRCRQPNRKVDPVPA